MSGQEFGLCWTTSDGREWTACGYSESGARKTAEAVQGRGYSVRARIVTRDVSEWRDVEAEVVPTGQETGE